MSQQTPALNRVTGRSDNPASSSAPQAPGTSHLHGTITPSLTLASFQGCRTLSYMQLNTELILQSRTRPNAPRSSELSSRPRCSPAQPPLPAASRVERKPEIATRKDICRMVREKTPKLQSTQKFKCRNIKVLTVKRQSRNCLLPDPSLKSCSIYSR